MNINPNSHMSLQAPELHLRELVLEPWIWHQNSKITTSTSTTTSHTKIKSIDWDSDNDPQQEEDDEDFWEESEE